jgi:hypothetical protein
MVKSKDTNDGNGRDGLHITAPNLREACFTIVGTSPYVQNKFSQKAKDEMKAKQEAGTTATKSRKKTAKNFKQCYEDAKYKPDKGTWPNGAIPATAIRAAMVAACRLVDFKMTEAKQCVYVEADGYDKGERIPLIKITKGKPTYFEQALRVANGNPDIRPRPLWEPGWEAKVRITYDADRFTLEDVANLLSRAGSQVGIGEGRQASKMCVGLGWGAFRLKSRVVTR